VSGGELTLSTVLLLERTPLWRRLRRPYLTVLLLSSMVVSSSDDGGAGGGGGGGGG